MLSKTLYTICISLLLSITASAQKVIVIDTLDFGDKSVILDRGCNLIGIFCGDTITDCIFLDSQIRCEVKFYTYDYPNLVAVVNQVSGIDYISVSIGLDNKGGSLKLLNIDKVKGDTIRINKWKVYDNKLGGYEVGYKLFYKKENDSMLLDRIPYKRELIKRYYSSKTDTLKSILITINGQKDTVPLTLNSSQHISTFHGYKPFRVYKKYMKYQDKHDEPLKRKFHYDYFWGTTNGVDYIYEATIDLSTAP